MTQSPTLVVIRNLDIRRMAISPPEADPPLLVDPDAVLASTVTLESSKLVRARNRQILQITRSIQLLQLHQCPLLNISWETLGILAFPDSFRLLVAKRFDHLLIVTRHVSAVKRYYEAGDQPAALVNAIPGSCRSDRSGSRILSRRAFDHSLRSAVNPIPRRFVSGEFMSCRIADRMPTIA